MQDLLDPAVIGTTEILHAIKNGAPSVKKVVITSSFAAVRDVSKGNWPEHTYSEADWNPMMLEEALSHPAKGYTGKSTAMLRHIAHRNGRGRWTVTDLYESNNDTF